MKIKGVKVQGPCEDVVVIPRGEKPAIVLRVRAVLDYEAFNKLCPDPEVPKSQRPGGEYFENPEDPAYKRAIYERRRKESDWTILQSLKATDQLEWETVKDDDPATWANWRTELKADGFVPTEIGMIFEAAWKVNTLSEEAVKAARESFFRSQEAR